MIVIKLFHKLINNCQPLPLMCFSPRMFTASRHVISWRYWISFNDGLRLEYQAWGRVRLSMRVNSNNEGFIIGIRFQTVQNNWGNILLMANA